MPTEQSMVCQQVIRRINCEDLVTYLSFLGQGSGAARLRRPTVHLAHFGSIVASPAVALCPFLGHRSLPRLGQ
jgi:hypothetical protein